MVGVKSRTAQVRIRSSPPREGRASDAILPAPIARERLPLSWTRAPITAPQVVSQNLPLSRCRWICWADLPEHWRLPDFLEQADPENRGALLIRGCPPEIAALLESRGWHSFAAGTEALLSLDGPHFRRASLQALVRRGNRRGRAEEVSFSPGVQTKFCRLLRGTAHAHKPQLRYLFRSELEPQNRCFVFRDHRGEWLAAMTLSRVSQEFWHTERLLRRQDAPVGVMEALAAHVFAQLQAEGARYWSLGEVPFVGVSGSSSLVKRAFIGAGRTFNFAYNYQGLFSFKSKFDPLWQPLYLCSTQRISWTMLWDLFEISGCRQLVQRQFSRLPYQPPQWETPGYETKECI